MPRSECFHYSFGLEKVNQPTPTPTNQLDQSDEEKRKYYKEQQASYYKKKGIIKYWGNPKAKPMKADIDLL